MTMTARIHTLKSRAGLDEVSYRDLLISVTGKRSAKDLSPDEGQRVCEKIEALFSPVVAPSSRHASGPYARKLQGLWMALHDLGRVTDRRDTAMMAFVRRQTGLDHTRFLTDAADAMRAIEALKKMAERAGVVWMTGKQASQAGLLPPAADRLAIVRAQLALLGPNHAEAVAIGVDLQKRSLQAPGAFGELLVIQSRLGVLIRAENAAKGGAA